MGMMDFLFDGKPPASVTSYGTTTQDMPKWLSDYTQGLISRANSIAGEPYQAYGGPRLADQTGDTQRAYDITRGNVGAQNGTINNAMNLAGGSIAAAQPYMQAAGRSFPQAVNEYMDPYVGNVIDRSTQMATRALNEKFLPSLKSTFGASGQDARSSAYRRAADRGVRDMTEGIQSNAQAALSGAYQNAGQMFGQDASRQGTLAQLASNNNLNAAQSQGTLAQLAQQMGLTDASALESIGASQQADTQRGLDLAYGDFQQQRDYPRSTIDWMSQVIRGMPSSQQVTSTQTQPGQGYSPSPISQLGSLGTGLAGILAAYKKAKGGRIRRYRYGGLRRGTLTRGR